ncbi:MAG: hypothetical protein HQL69_15925 [Magnetococcales bacterium]|nr:hypothetical protein [Magnetococcales bacterium]
MRYILIFVVFLSGCTIHKSKNIHTTKQDGVDKKTVKQTKKTTKKPQATLKKHVEPEMTATQKKLLELYQNRIISHADYIKGSNKIKEDIKSKNENITLDVAHTLHKSAIKLKKIEKKQPRLKLSKDEVSWQNYDRGPWYTSSSLVGVAGAYSGSSERDRFYSVGFTFSGEYYERKGFLFGYTNSTIEFKDGVDSTDQNEFLLGIHNNFNLDGLKGTFDIRLNGHFISNNDSSGNSDKVKVLAPAVSYLPYKKSYYLDLGYAYSLYQNDLNVNQIAPAFGFAFNDSADWLQLRGYFIYPSNSARAEDKDSTSAIQGKWTHWFKGSNSKQPDIFSLSGMLGERIYAVDLDSLAVYNLADVQKGSVGIDLTWKTGNDMTLLLHAGHNLYEKVSISENYSSTAIALSLSKEW